MSANIPLLVKMQNVSKHYAHFSLRNINLELPQGEIMGLVGPNGAGKSTLLKLLLGFIGADEGQIQILGQDLRSHELLIKQNTSYVSEEMGLYGHKTLDWHMRFFAQAFERWDNVYAQTLLHRFELNTNILVKHFSLGQRIKATLLLAIARRPQLLVLDEPSTGLDPVARHELTSVLLEIMLNEDNSVIFSSQLTQDVERLSDRIGFIDQGLLISNQDKESYFDQWKRLELTCKSGLPALSNLHALQHSGEHYTCIDTAFGPARAGEFVSAGVTIKQISNLTLEEIFIQQVLIRRRLGQGI